MSKLKKTKSTDLISVIIYGLGDVGFGLTKELALKGSKVIIVDHYSSGSSKRIKELKALGDVDFIDIQGIDGLLSTLPRIDYLFYVMTDLLETPWKTFDKTSYVKELHNVEKVFEKVREFKAKSSLITSALIHKYAHLTDSSRESKLSSMSLQQDAEKTVAHKFDKSSLNARIIRLGTLIGNVNKINDDVTLNNMLSDLVKRGVLEIVGDGLDTHFLIDIEDAIKGIIQLTFDNKTAGEVITLAIDKQFTTLSIAYKLLELTPKQASIRFIDDPQRHKRVSDHYIAAPYAREFGEKPTHDLEESLHNLLKIAAKRKSSFNIKKSQDSQPLQRGFLKPKKSATSVQHHTVETKQTRLGALLSSIKHYFHLPNTQFASNLKNSIKGNLLFIIFWLILLIPVFYFLIFPIIEISWYGGRLCFKKSDISTHTSMQDLPALKNDLAGAIDDIDGLQGGLNKLSWAFNALHQEDLFANTQLLLASLKSTTHAGYELSIGLEPYLDYYKRFEPAIDMSNTRHGSVISYHSELQQMQDNSSHLKTALMDIQYSESLLSKIQVNSFPSFLRDDVIDYRAKHHKMADAAQPTLTFLPQLPEILGIDGRRRYLVILQNPSELRSTGGWISSVAVIGIEDGQLREFYTDDIYNVIGTAKRNGITNEAPETMQVALGIETWDMSLANWDPDFPTTSKYLSRFARQSSLTPKTDGVFAIDVTLIQMFLKQWGGLVVEGEPDIITADNLYDKIFEIHNEFTPGARRKTDFLANLSDAFINELLHSNTDSYAKNFEILKKGLDEKHLLINFNDSHDNSTFALNKWNGPVDKEYSYAPFSVEWNWGGNKANLFIERKQKLYIDILNPNEISYTYKTIIRNLSQTDSYPEGPYVDYHRFYINDRAKIVDFSGFDQDSVSSQLDYLQDGYHIIGGFFTVDINSTKTIKFNTNIVRQEKSYFPLNSEGDTISLDLLLFKQPGVYSNDYEIKITYPANWNPVDYAPFQIDEQKSELSLSTEQLTDIPVHITWERQ